MRIQFTESVLKDAFKIFAESSEEVEILAHLDDDIFLANFDYHYDTKPTSAHLTLTRKPL